MPPAAYALPAPQVPQGGIAPYIHQPERYHWCVQGGEECTTRHESASWQGYVLREAAAQVCATVVLVLEVLDFANMSGFKYVFPLQFLFAIVAIAYYFVYEGMSPWLRVLAVIGPISPGCILYTVLLFLSQRRRRCQLVTQLSSL
jgi:uncharacterized membrane protein